MKGTINLDYRSLYHHFENGCLIARSHAVTEIRQDFERTFEESTEVTDKYREIRVLYLRLGQQVLRLFAELL